MPTESEYAVPMSVVKLVKKVQKHILEEPKRLNMHDWVNRLEDVLEGDPTWDQRQMAKFPVCGTTGCIAGWTVLLSRPVVKDEKGHLVVDRTILYESEAAALLQIKDGYSAENACTDTLFYAGNWPEPYRSQYYGDGLRIGSPEAAKITVDRLEHFLTTGK